MKTILILSQVYPPDSASVGQHLADLAVGLKQRGYRVEVVTARRGYDDPSVRYAAREVRDGVHIRRVSFASFGKSHFALRAVAMLVFIAWSIWYGLTTRRLAAIVVSTTPPFVGLAAGLVRVLRGTPFVYWVMDLNPDQMIALGAIRQEGLLTRLLDRIERFVLRRASAVVALDHFMAERVMRRADVSAKLDVFPPWPHHEPPAPVAHADNRFRARNDLQDRFVVMYSGNHGHSTPVDALLEAARRLADEPRVLFLFVGGGVLMPKIAAYIERHRPQNVRALPYQPLADLPFSLSAADVHLVTMQADVVGIVHPCKVYGAMGVARPVLLLGPEQCHVADLMRDYRIGWHVADSAPEAVAATIREIVQTDPSELRRMGLQAHTIVRQLFSKDVLRGRLCDIVERQVGV